MLDKIEWIEKNLPEGHDILIRTCASKRSQFWETSKWFVHLTRDIPDENMPNGVKGESVYIVYTDDLDKALDNAIKEIRKINVKQQLQNDVIFYR